MARCAEHWMEGHGALRRALEGEAWGTAQSIEERHGPLRRAQLRHAGAGRGGLMQA